MDPKYKNAVVEKTKYERWNAKLWMLDKKPRLDFQKKFYSRLPSFPFSSNPQPNPQIPFWKLALSNYVDMKRKIVGTLSWVLLVISSHYIYRIGGLLFPNSRDGNLVNLGSSSRKADSSLVHQCAWHLQIERERRIQGCLIRESEERISTRDFFLEKFFQKTIKLRSFIC